MTKMERKNDLLAGVRVGGRIKEATPAVWVADRACNSLACLWLLFASGLMETSSMGDVHVSIYVSGLCAYI